jgi:hypothetical protein
LKASRARGRHQIAALVAQEFAAPAWFPLSRCVGRQNVTYQRGNTMSKKTVKCESFKPFRRNTLYGFAEILIAEIGLRIKDVTIFEKNGKRWASLPSKPMLKDNMLIKDEDGKGVYTNILEFPDRDVRDAFSQAVVAAVLEHAPDAFDDEATSRQSARDDPF